LTATPSGGRHTVAFAGHDPMLGLGESELENLFREIDRNGARGRFPPRGVDACVHGRLRA
jgi:hypothetical protein